MKTRFLNGLMLILLLASFALVFATMCSGCQSADLAQLQQTVTDARHDLKDLQARATTMPADSPDRKLIEANAGKIEVWLAKADPILKAAQSGDIAAVGAAAGAVGIPYAGLIAFIAAFGFREIQAYKARQQLQQAQSALRQASDTIDHALPAADPRRQEVIDKTQDSTTQAILATVKAS